MGSRRHRVAALAASAGLLLARGAAAQEVDAAVRRELLEQAQTAREAGDHAHALDYANRAGRISMTPSLRMFIAAEESALARPAEALNDAELCIREAEHDPTLRNRDTILRDCHQIEAETRARVGRVTVQVPTPAPAGLVVQIGGATVNDAFYGVPYIVNPGTVVVQATAPGRRSFRQEVSVAQSATVSVAIELPAGDAAATTQSGTTSTASGTSVEHTQPTSTEHAATNTTATSGPSSPASSTGESAQPATTAAQPSGGPGVLPFVVMGVGVVGLGLSAIFFVVRNNAVSSLESMCFGADHTSCPQSAMGTYSTASTFNTLTNVALIGGSVVLVAGAAWWVVSKLMGGHPDQPAHAHLEFAPLPGGAMLGVGGTL